MSSNSLPTLLRLNRIYYWNSEWYGDFDYSSLLLQDVQIRSYLYYLSYSLRCPSNDIVIKRFNHRLIVINYMIYLPEDERLRFFVFSSKFSRAKVYKSVRVVSLKKPRTKSVSYNKSKSRVFRSRFKFYKIRKRRKNSKRIFIYNRLKKKMYFSFFYGYYLKKYLSSSKLTAVYLINIWVKFFLSFYFILFKLSSSRFFSSCFFFHNYLQFFYFLISSNFFNIFLNNYYFYTNAIFFFYKSSLFYSKANLHLRQFFNYYYLSDVSYTSQLVYFFNDLTKKPLQENLNVSKGHLSQSSFFSIFFYILFFRLFFRYVSLKLRRLMYSFKRLQAFFGSVSSSSTFSSYYFFLVRLFYFFVFFNYNSILVHLEYRISNLKSSLKKINSRTCTLDYTLYDWICRFKYFLKVYGVKFNLLSRSINQCFSLSHNRRYFTFFFLGKSNQLLNYFYLVSFFYKTKENLSCGLLYSSSQLSIVTRCLSIFYYYFQVIYLLRSLCSTILNTPSSRSLVFLYLFLFRLYVSKFYCFSSVLKLNSLFFYYLLFKSYSFNLFQYFFMVRSFLHSLVGSSRFMYIHSQSTGVVHNNLNKIVSSETAANSQISLLLHSLLVNHPLLLKSLASNDFKFYFFYCVNSIHLRGYSNYYYFNLFRNNFYSTYMNVSTNSRNLFNHFNKMRFYSRLSNHYDCLPSMDFCKLVGYKEKYIYPCMHIKSRLLLNYHSASRSMLDISVDRFSHFYFFKVLKFLYRLFHNKHVLSRRSYYLYRLFSHYLLKTRFFLNSSSFQSIRSPLSHRFFSSVVSHSNGILKGSSSRILFRKYLFGLLCNSFYSSVRRPYFGSKASSLKRFSTLNKCVVNSVSRKRAMSKSKRSYLSRRVPQALDLKCSLGSGVTSNSINLNTQFGPFSKSEKVIKSKKYDFFDQYRNGLQRGTWFFNSFYVSEYKSFFNSSKFAKNRLYLPSFGNSRHLKRKSYNFKFKFNSNKYSPISSLHRKNIFSLFSHFVSSILSRNIRYVFFVMLSRLMRLHTSSRRLSFSKISMIISYLKRYIFLKLAVNFIRGYISYFSSMSSGFNITYGRLVKFFISKVSFMLSDPRFINRFINFRLFGDISKSYSTKYLIARRLNHFNHCYRPFINTQFFNSYFFYKFLRKDSLSLLRLNRLQVIRNFSDRHVYSNRSARYVKKFRSFRYGSQSRLYRRTPHLLYHDLNSISNYYRKDFNLKLLYRLKARHYYYHVWSLNSYFNSFRYQGFASSSSSSRGYAFRRNKKRVGYALTLSGFSTLLERSYHFYKNPSRMTIESLIDCNDFAIDTFKRKYSKLFHRPSRESSSYNLGLNMLNSVSNTHSRPNSFFLKSPVYNYLYFKSFLSHGLNPSRLFNLRLINRLVRGSKSLSRLKVPFSRASYFNCRYVYNRRHLSSNSLRHRIFVSKPRFRLSSLNLSQSYNCTYKYYGSPYRFFFNQSSIHSVGGSLYTVFANVNKLSRFISMIRSYRFSQSFNRFSLFNFFLANLLNDQNSLKFNSFARLYFYNLKHSRHFHYYNSLLSNPELLKKRLRSNSLLKSFTVAREFHNILNTISTISSRSSSTHLSGLPYKLFLFYILSLHNVVSLNKKLSLNSALDLYTAFAGQFVSNSSVKSQVSGLDGEMFRRFSFFFKTPLFSSFFANLFNLSRNSFQFFDYRFLFKRSRSFFISKFLNSYFNFTKLPSVRNKFKSVRLYSNTLLNCTYLNRFNHYSKYYYLHFFYSPSSSLSSSIFFSSDLYRSFFLHSLYFLKTSFSGTSFELSHGRYMNLERFINKLHSLHSSKRIKYSSRRNVSTIYNTSSYKDSMKKVQLSGYRRSTISSYTNLFPLYVSVFHYFSFQHSFDHISVDTFHTFFKFLFINSGLGVVRSFDTGRFNFSSSIFPYVRPFYIYNLYYKLYYHRISNNFVHSDVYFNKLSYLFNYSRLYTLPRKYFDSTSSIHSDVYSFKTLPFKSVVYPNNKLISYCSSLIHLFYYSMSVSSRISQDFIIFLMVQYGRLLFPILSGSIYSEFFSSFIYYLFNNITSLRSIWSFFRGYVHLQSLGHSYIYNTLPLFFNFYLPFITDSLRSNVLSSFFRSTSFHKIFILYSLLVSKQRGRSFKNSNSWVKKYSFISNPKFIKSVSLLSSGMDIGSSRLFFSNFSSRSHILLFFKLFNSRYFRSKFFYKSVPVLPSRSGRRSLSLYSKLYGILNLMLLSRNKDYKSKLYQFKGHYLTKKNAFVRRKFRLWYRGRNRNKLKHRHLFRSISGRFKRVKSRNKNTTSRISLRRYPHALYKRSVFLLYLFRQSFKRSLSQFVLSINNTLNEYYQSFYVLYIPYIFWKERPPVLGSMLLSQYIAFEIRKSIPYREVMSDVNRWISMDGSLKRNFITSGGSFARLHENHLPSFVNVQSMVSSFVPETVYYPLVGCKIVCAGRPFGKPRKAKFIKLFRSMPSNSLDTYIDYYQITTFTKYGSLGFKVWTFFSRKASSIGRTYSGL